MKILKIQNIKISSKARFPLALTRWYSFDVERELALNYEKAFIF